MRESTAREMSRRVRRSMMPTMPHMILGLLIHHAAGGTRGHARRARGFRAGCDTNAGVSHGSFVHAHVIIHHAMNAELVLHDPPRSLAVATRERRVREILDHGARHEIAAGTQH